MGKAPIDMVRTQEKLFKSDFKDKNITEEEWFVILSENPRLLKRPIIEADNNAVLAQPPDEIEKLR